MQNDRKAMLIHRAFRQHGGSIPRMTAAIRKAEDDQRREGVEDNLATTEVKIPLAPPLQSSDAHPPHGSKYMLRGMTNETS